jgi:uncharacterized protein YjdB
MKKKNLEKLIGIAVFITVIGLSFTSCPEDEVIFPVKSVSLDEKSITLDIGDSETLTATVLPAYATNKELDWNSDDTDVATVSDGTITGVAAGTAKITVTTKDGNKTDYCTVTVNAAHIHIPVTAVSINNKPSSPIAVNGTLTLTKTITPTDATNTAVTWSSSNTAIATVSQSGVVTGKANGTATITVTAADTTNGTITDSCPVTVNSINVAVTSVSLNKSSTAILVNNTDTLTATVEPSNATNKKVTWQSSNTSIATVSTTGVVTGKAVGQTTITVTTEDGNFTASCAVTVNVNNVAVTGVSLNKSSTILQVKTTETLIATVLPGNATNKNVTWRSDKSSIATVSQNGVVTAGVNNGTATITVTTSDGNNTATCTVNVTGAVPVTGISLDKTNLALDLDDAISKGKGTLKALFTPTNATNTAVTWTSSNTDVASVSSAGEVTGLTQGTATITATTADGGFTATCTVTVTGGILVTGVSLDKSLVSLSVNATEKLTATVYPSNATYKAVKWESYNTGIATVSSVGTVTGKSAGNTIITVTTVDGSHTATCNVTVHSDITNVTLDKNTLNLTVNSTDKLTATVLPSDAKNKNITWISSDEDIATVSTSGLVTAKSVGTAYITAYATVDSSQYDTCEVNVRIAVTGVSLSKTATYLTTNGTETLTAIVFPSNANQNVTWSSSNSSVATVSYGIITGVGAGTATITVTTDDDNKTATCTVSVSGSPVSVTGVSLNKSTTTIAAGGTEILRATITPANATNQDLEWSSNNTSVATVTDGIITGKAAGTATITVTVGDKTAECVVTVIGTQTPGGLAAYLGMLSSLINHDVAVVVTSTSEFSTIKTALNNSPSKYVKLHLIGSVASISSSAFSSCSTLVGVVIPSSITSIGNSAFSNCSSLTSVIFCGYIPSAGFSTSSFPGDLRDKFYTPNSAYGTPGTYTRTSGSATWTRQ